MCTRHIVVSYHHYQSKHRTADTMSLIRAAEIQLEKAIKAKDKYEQCSIMSVTASLCRY